MEEQITPNIDSVPPPDQPIRRPMSTKKYLKYGTIALLLLVFIAGVIFIASNKGRLRQPLSPSPTITVKPTATPTPISTATWQAYTNPQYGFSLKYPLDYHVQEATYPDYGIFIVSLTNYSDQSVPFSSTDKLNIDFAVAEKQPNNQNPLYYQCCAFGWIDYNLNALTPLANDAQINGLTKIGTTTTAGVKTISFKLLHENATGSLTSAALFAGFTKDTTAYLIHATSGKENLIFEKENAALVDQIRASFLFIPKQPAASSSATASPVVTKSL